MAFTPYSQIVKPAEFVQPIPLDLLMRGAVYNQEKQEKAVNQIQSAIDYFGGLPSLPGADSQKKNEIINNFMNNIQEMNISDLKNPNTLSQINSNISALAQDPDIQAIVKRAGDYKKHLDKKDEITKTGAYIAPWDMAPLQDAEDYINKGEYIRDKRFSGDIFKSPDFNKFYDEAAKAVESEEGIDMNKAGYDVKYEEKSIEKLSAGILNRIKANPETAAALQRQFNYSTRGMDWSQYASSNYMQKAQQASATYDNLSIAMASTTNPVEKARLQEQLTKVGRDYANYLQLAQNPNPEIARSDAYEEYLTNSVIDQASTYVFHKTKDIRANEYSKMNYQASLTRQNEEFKALLDAGLITDKDGNPIPGKSTSGSADGYMLQELEQFRNSGGAGSPDILGNFKNPQNMTATQPVLGVFKTSVFAKKITKPKRTTSYEYNAKTKENEPKGYTETSVTELEYPVSNTYDPSSDTYTLIYSDGTTERISHSGVLDKLIVTKPSLGKMIGKPSTISLSKELDSL